MEFTVSYERIVPQVTRDRYAIIETRNAAVVIAATNPASFDEVLGVLGGFNLCREDIVNPGGGKSACAIRLDKTFRDIGWRAANTDTKIVSTVRLRPYREGGEEDPVIIEHESVSAGYEVDNVKGRLALDVEWNAKDGNLDRDLARYRALYDAGVIDGGILITREYASILALSRRLGREAFNTTTTTTLEKLTPRLSRGDAGGCPVLAFAITDRCYSP